MVATTTYECICGHRHAIWSNRAKHRPVISEAEEALAEVRRWVESIGATNLDTGRRIVKADVLAIIDAKLRAHAAQSISAAAARSAPPERKA